MSEPEAELRALEWAVPMLEEHVSGGQWISDVSTAELLLLVGAMGVADAVTVQVHPDLADVIFESRSARRQA